MHAQLSCWVQQIKELQVNKEQWGRKLTCHNCGVKFYDLKKKTITCPKCDAPYKEEKVKSRRSISAEITKPVKEPVKELASRIRFPIFLLISILVNFQFGLQPWRRRENGGGIGSGRSCRVSDGYKNFLFFLENYGVLRSILRILEIFGTKWGWIFFSSL